MPITQDITDHSLCMAGTDGGTITTTNLSAGTLSGMDLDIILGADSGHLGTLDVAHLTLLPPHW